MPRRTIPLIVMLAILATLVIPAGSAEAKWVTAHNGWGMGDPVVCRDAMSFGAGLTSSLAPEKGLLLRATLEGQITSEVLITQTVKLYRVAPTITPDGAVLPLAMIGFPTFKWPRLLPAGSQVVIEDLDPVSDFGPTKVLVNDCLFFGDNFTRADGLPGSNWLGNSVVRANYGYYIRDRLLDIDAGGPLYWGTSLGVAQGAWARISTVDTHVNSEQGLLLKVQRVVQSGQPDWKQGAIKVVYQSGSVPSIVVATYKPGGTWSRIGMIENVSFNHGNILQARVIGNELFVIQSLPLSLTDKIEGMGDGKMLGHFLISDPFFADKGGNTGLWFENAGDARIDRFGGGNISLGWSDGPKCNPCG